MERRIVEMEERARAARADMAIEFDRDEDGRPVIERCSTRISDLEHRLDYLERNYDPTRRGAGAARIIGEIWAIRAGIEALKYWQAEDQQEKAVWQLLRRLLRELRTYDPDDVDEHVLKMMAEASALLDARDAAIKAHVATQEAAREAG